MAAITEDLAHIQGEHRKENKEWTEQKKKMKKKIIDEKNQRNNGGVLYVQK